MLAATLNLFHSTKSCKKDWVSQHKKKNFVLNLLPKKQLSIAAVRERAHSSHQNQNKQNKKFPDRKTLVSANCDETVLVLSAKVCGLDKVGRIYQLSKPKLNLRRFPKMDEIWSNLQFSITIFLTAEKSTLPCLGVQRHPRKSLAGTTATTNYCKLVSGGQTFISFFAAKGMFVTGATINIACCFCCTLKVN